jgi:hypothetical protein
MTHPFNSDSDFVELFSQHHLAEKAYYSSTYINAGTRGQYGLGAGTSINSCSGSGYKADVFNARQNAQDCRMISPYCVAGYMPADKDNITQELYDLLEDGFTVLPILNTEYYVLWRKSLVDKTWT